MHGGYATSKVKRKARVEGAGTVDVDVREDHDDEEPEVGESLELFEEVPAQRHASTVKQHSTAIHATCCRIRIRTRRTCKRAWVRGYCRVHGAWHRVSSLARRSTQVRSRVRVVVITDH